MELVPSNDTPFVLSRKLEQSIVAVPPVLLIAKLPAPVTVVNTSRENVPSAFTSLTPLPETVSTVRSSNLLFAAVFFTVIASPVTLEMCVWPVTLRGAPLTVRPSFEFRNSPPMNVLAPPTTEIPPQ